MTKIPKMYKVKYKTVTQEREACMLNAKREEAEIKAYLSLLWHQ